MCGEKVALSLPYFLGDSCAPPCTVVDHVSVASRAAKACQSDSERLYREGFGDARGFGALAPGGISSAAQPVTDKLKLGCEEEAPRAKKPNSLLRWIWRFRDIRDGTIKRNAWPALQSAVKNAW